MTDSDLDLIKAVQAESFLSGTGQKAFDELVKRYQKPLFNFIYRYVGERSAAEDLAQEVFLRVWQAAPRFEARGKVSTWIFKIAYNLSMNEIKRRRRYQNFYKGFCDDVRAESLFPEQWESRELEADVMRALAQVPENQRAALLLRVNDGFSYKEISEILNMSPAAVESLIFRARTKLKEVRSEQLTRLRAGSVGDREKVFP
jgi:RNA polymerase sigma-70 factor, ECF subfamily